MHTPNEKELKTGLYGLAAEFDTPDDIIEATKQVKRAGYSRIDAFSPYPVEELSELIIKRPTRLPWLIFLGGVVGCIGGYLLQYWTQAIEYPLNVGGRPYNSWVSFLPVTFECTILLASLTAVFGMLFLNGFPQPYHPIFNVPRFDLASRNRFFLLIEAADPKFNRTDTSGLLNRLNAREVTDVEY